MQSKWMEGELQKKAAFKYMFPGYIDLILVLLLKERGALLYLIYNLQQRVTSSLSQMQQLFLFTFSV